MGCCWLPSPCRPWQRHGSHPTAALAAGLPAQSGISTPVLLTLGAAMLAVIRRCVVWKVWDVAVAVRLPLRLRPPLRLMRSPEAWRPKQARRLGASGCAPVPSAGRQKAPRPRRRALLAGAGGRPEATSRMDGERNLGVHVCLEGLQALTNSGAVAWRPRPRLTHGGSAQPITAGRAAVTGHPRRRRRP